MYLQHFNFEVEPFALAPDSNFLFLSRTHKKALVYLNYALWNRDNFTLISGAIGTGKTILLQRLLKTVPEDTIVITINQTQVSPLELLEVVVDQIGMDKPEKPTKARLYKLLKQFFASHSDKSIVFVIDEAQRMPMATLEELRLLASNDLSDTNININIILCGQPELRTMIECPELEQLNQRIRLKFDLKRLGSLETIEYIRYRLMRSGQTLDLFSNNSLTRIYQYTNGLPRKINMMCDTALTCAFADGLKSITTAQIDDAASELQWPQPDNQSILDREVASPDAEKIIRLKPNKKPSFKEDIEISQHLRNIEMQLSKIANSLSLIANVDESRKKTI